jgi:hypothetical protein
MKRYFIDTEFNGMGGQLISMALAPEDLTHPVFYRELRLKEPLETWVVENVITKLDDAPVDYETFQKDLEAFLAEVGDCTIIADWPDDITYFTKALITGPGTAIQTPAITLVLDRRIDGVESATPHHAMADAVANRKFYLTHNL